MKNCALRVVAISAMIVSLFLSSSVFGQNCSPGFVSDYMPFYDSDPTFQLQELQIRLVVHVVAKSDKSGNFPHSNATETTSSKSEIQAIITKANSQLANIASPLYFDNGQQQTGIPHTSDAKIKWLLDNSDIIFHDDDALFDLGKTDYNELEFFDQLETKTNTHANIFLVEDANTGITGVGNGPHVSMMDVRVPILGMYKAYSTLGQSDYGSYKYIWANNFNHELCHALAGMDHSIENETQGIFPELPWPDRFGWVNPSATEQNISNNMMGGSKQQDYLSPNQIKFWHQGIMSRSCRKYVANIASLTVEDYHYTISSNVTWDKYAVINNDISIKSGATLTISGCVQMSRDAVINVEEGGTLLFDGGSIKRAGVLGLWGGIKVWGDKTKDQYAQSQHFGKVRSTANGGHISGAETAISTSKLDYGDVFDWSHTGGGIVQLRKCTFENNIRDVQFLKYTYIHPVTNSVYKNASYFQQCEFITTEPLPNLSPYTVLNGLLRKYEPHATLWANHGVRFTRCKFINYQQYDNGSNNNGVAKSDNFLFYVGKEKYDGGNFDPKDWISRIGIGTHSSYLELRGTPDPGCLSNCPKTGNYFYGLGTGIVLRGIDRAYEGIALIDNNIFTNCNLGIDVLSSANDLVDNNAFKWQMNFSEIFLETGNSTQGQGMNLNASAGFTIQDNRFRSYIPLYEQLYKPRGIYSQGVLNTYAGLSHFNVFRDNWPSVKIDYDNPGHRITCNEYINQGYPSIPNTDYQLNFKHFGDPGPQGFCDPDVGWLPRNKFQENCDNAKDHIESDKGNIPRPQRIDYYYHSSEAANTLPQQSCVTPHPVGGTYIHISNCTTVTHTTCARVAHPKVWKYYAESNDYDGFINAAMTDLEAGDHADLKNDLGDPLVSNSQLIADLDAARPYLSDEVLVLMINRQPAFNETYLKTVLLEHSGLSDAVMLALVNSNVSSATWNEIEAAEDQYSSIHELYDYIDAALWNKMRVVYGFEQQLRDTVNNDTLNLDTLFAFYNSLQGGMDKGHHINGLIESADYTAATNLLNTLDQNDAEQAALYDFESLHLALQSDNRNWFQVTGTELNELEDIAQGNTRAAGYAKNVLNLIEMEPYEFSWVEATEQNTAYANLNIESQPKEEMVLFSIYPNPVEEVLTIRLAQGLADNAQVPYTITGIQGSSWHGVIKSEETRINISSLPSGLYLVSVHTSRGFQSQRFIKL